MELRIGWSVKGDGPFEITARAVGEWPCVIQVLLLPSPQMVAMSATELDQLRQVTGIRLIEDGKP